MRAYNLKSIIRRKRPGFVRTKPEQVGENKLNREFSTSSPNEKWLSDIQNSNMAMQVRNSIYVRY